MISAQCMIDILPWVLHILSNCAYTFTSSIFTTILQYKGVSSIYENWDDTNWWHKACYTFMNVVPLCSGNRTDVLTNNDKWIVIEHLHNYVYNGGRCYWDKTLMCKRCWCGNLLLPMFNKLKTSCVFLSNSFTLYDIWSTASVKASITTILLPCVVITTYIVTQLLPEITDLQENIYTYNMLVSQLHCCIVIQYTRVS